MRSDLPGRVDAIARLLCVVIGVAWGIGASYAYAAGERGWFWLLAAIAALFVVVATFGPRSVRTALVSWFP